MNLVEKNNKKGFTLVELVIVIAVLGILALIAVSNLSGFTEQAKQVSDEQLCAVLANAASMYYARYELVPADTNALNLAGLVQYTNETVLNAFKSRKYKNQYTAVIFTRAASTSGATVEVTIGSEPNTYTVRK